MAKHKTEKRLIEHLLDNLPGETWEKEKTVLKIVQALKL